MLCTVYIYIYKYILYIRVILGKFDNFSLLVLLSMYICFTYYIRHKSKFDKFSSTIITFVVVNVCFASFCVVLCSNTLSSRAVLQL